MKSLFYRIIATFTFFTRLPFWRLANVPADYYKRVVPLWPLVGWITGGSMAVVAMLTSSVSPVIAVLLMLIIRILITGALHEDGFADFCDGFGGGTSREQTLEIMKDSHIGTYGVIGLVLYFALLTATLSDLHTKTINTLQFVSCILIADIWCKWLSSTIIYFLPYARNAEEAKNKLIYAQVSTAEKLLSLFMTIISISLFIPYLPQFTIFIYATMASVVMAGLLFRLMHKRINGYTGDCCGATFVLTETTFILVIDCAFQ